MLATCSSINDAGSQELDNEILIRELYESPKFKVPTSDPRENQSQSASASPRDERRNKTMFLELKWRSILMHTWYLVRSIPVSHGVELDENPPPQMQDVCSIATPSSAETLGAVRMLLGRLLNILTLNSK
jgi:hypothetical protein